MTTVDACIYCGQTVKLATDGAWELYDGGSCGCTESLEKGGDGEHEGRPVNTMDAAGEIRLVDVQMARFPDGSPNPYEFGC